MAAPSTPKQHHPLVKAADIDASLQTLTHFLNKKAVTRMTCMSEMAGITDDFGVHKVVVPPNRDSTELHHHVNNSEWVYILKGAGVLLLTPADGDPDPAPGRGLVPLPKYTGPVEELPIAAGDFMGHPAGAGDGLYAHGMRAGPEGLEYLVGGTRKSMDMAVYPLQGKTMLTAGQSGARVGGGTYAIVDSGAIKNPFVKKE